MTSISGMTGFGRADGSAEGWTWSVEARSVNGRNLEVRFRGPNGFDTLERLTKAAGQARFARGQINVGLHARRDGAAASPVAVNEALLTHYLMLANQLAEEGATPPSADGLLSLRGGQLTPTEAGLAFLNHPDPIPAAADHLRRPAVIVDRAARALRSRGATW